MRQPLVVGNWKMHGTRESVGSLLSALVGSVNVDAAADSLIQITAVDNFGTLFDFGSFTADGSGQNFFTIGSDDVQWARIVNIYGDGINVLTEL